MLQQWFNVAGLSLDFIGVLLLAYEWWIALSAERANAERDAFEQRIRPSPMMPKPKNPHQPMHDYMRDQLRFQREHAQAHTIRGMRRSWFTAALVLIALGFMLQIIGSWPLGIAV